MNPDHKNVISELGEILNGFDNDLDFKIIGDSEIEFNRIDDASHGCRLKYNVETKETAEMPLLNNDSNEVNSEVTVICAEKPKEYLLVSNNSIDIPLLHSLGINYIVCHNQSALSDYTEILNDASIILTTKSQSDIEAIQTMFNIQTPIVSIDFGKLCETYKEDDSMLDLAFKLQESGKEGIEGINKFLYSESKTYAHTGMTEKCVEAVDIENNANTVDDESIATQEDAKTPSVADKEFSPSPVKSEYLRLTELKADKKYQSRATEFLTDIDDLVQAYKDKEAIPPIDVVRTEEDEYIIVDGHHRHAAAQKAGMERMECRITEGSEHDAFVLSLGANANNKALKRTNADKNKAVTTALTCGDFNRYSNREIAKLCKVSSTFVDKVSKQLQENNDSEVSTANVCTQEDLSFNENEADTTSGASIEREENKPVIASAQKPMKRNELLKNQYISLSVNLKSKRINEESYQALLTDLYNVINTYAIEFKEVI